MNIRYIFQITLFVVFALLISNSFSYAHEQKQYKPYIGFTPWPYDLTLDAVNKTYKFISNNSNIISHHLDGGVPWNEALSNNKFPKHLRNDWNFRISRTPKSHKILLSVTPLNSARTSLASYWGNNADNQPLPRKWKGKKFNDIEVKQAFLNYTLRAIKFFKPDYLAIGIESNIMISKAPKYWRDYIELNTYIYNNVKNKYPDLPVFTTIQYEHLRGIESDSKKNLKLQMPLVKELMKHSDYLALSTYNYGFLHSNPPNKNYFDLALSFNKPIAIAESGAMSVTTSVMGTSLKASEDGQKEFVEMILNSAVRYKFPFVINWVSIDFDPMLKKLPKGVREISKAWVHTGLVTYNDHEKKAYKVWKNYLKNN